MSKHSIRYILSILFLMGIWFCGMRAQQAPKQQKHVFYGDSLVYIPEFQKNFELLRKNRVLYNAYNDSIFMIHDHDQWVHFFRRRALKNHHIFLANKVALSNIFDYFKQDSIPAIAYEQLFNSFFNDYMLKGGEDPFLTLKVCQILQDFNQHCPAPYNSSNQVNLWLADVYVQMANLGNDSTLVKKAAECLKQVLTEEAKSYPYYEKKYPLALLNLVKIVFLQYKVMGIGEHRHYVNLLREWYQANKNSKEISEANMNSIRNQILYDDETVLRNVYMVDSTVMSKQMADSLMNLVVDRNLANRHLSQISASRTLVMEVRLGRLSASKAIKLSLRRYREMWKELKKKKLSPEQLRTYIMPFYTFFYLNDVSDDSYARKRRIVRRMCRDIETAYQHRKDQQRQTGYVKYLNTLTTYPRITKYLKPEERVHFLNALNVATQVTTYAHSVHVSLIAELLMKSIIAYQPELLVGSLGDLQVTEIQKNQKKYLEFVQEAAMYHDLGKNSITSVVNNDYRPLTDEEFAIIKRHPELGMQYLDLAPSLEKYRDTTLGHHKWYDGKGGYPASFDNTKSPKRIMIDIVTLSDCLQAATERIGRNYKGDKTFEKVMEEFRQGAGTQYNPDLVALIDAHPDLVKKLANLIDDGWVEIYYGIYSQYFRK